MSRKLFIYLQTACLLSSFVGLHQANAFSGLTGNINRVSSAIKGQSQPAFNRQEAAQQRMNEWNRQARVRENAALAKQELFKRQNEERRRAAEQRMQQWNQNAEARRRAALAQQQRWKQDAETRRAAAQRKMDQWNREADARHRAALAQQEQWKRQFEKRHNDAQRGYDYWRSNR